MRSHTKEWRDISHNLGFSAQLNLSTGEIKFQDILPRFYNERKAKDIKELWADPINKKFEDKVIHRIYRYIGDSPDLERVNLKLDITVILPNSWHDEFAKTTGHYHLPLKENLPPSPDFYQLVYGKGVILIQREVKRKIISYIIEPKLFEPVFIPPGYAHVTINTGRTPLVFQNICVRTPHLLYEPILRRKGMSYYLIKEMGVTHFLPNPQYQREGYKIERVRKVFIHLAKEGFQKPIPFYQYLKSEPSKLALLAGPKRQRYLIDFSS